MNTAETHAPPPLDRRPMIDAAAASAASGAAVPDWFVPAPADWRQALERAIAEHPQGKRGVAQKMADAGYPVSRSYISRVAGGDLQHRPPAAFIRRVQAVLMHVACPHLGRELPPGECLQYASRKYAHISGHEVDHWRACRACPNNPTRPERPPTAGQPDPAEQPATEEDDAS